jgi:AraC-like DNA-binding protein
MRFIKTNLKEDIVIKSVVTIHYFELSKNYKFLGESHNFWELVYLDKGELEVLADNNVYVLNQGEMIFHKPNEFHSQWCNGKVAPNILVISFYCNSPAIKYFENKIISTSNSIRDTLSRIGKEANLSFDLPIKTDFIKQEIKLSRRYSSPIGSEQLIKIYLEQLLICLLRKDTSINKIERLSNEAKILYHKEISNNIEQFLNKHIYGSISFEDVSHFCNLSKTTLKVIYKEITGKSIMDFYKHLKIEEAKRLIREESFNFTEISDKLGYTSLHHFSKQFKNITGTTPTEYSTSIKSDLSIRRSLG